MSIPRQYSHPLLWSMIIIGFTVMVAFFFRFWYSQGAVVGAGHPRPTDTGVEVPDHAEFIAQIREPDQAILELGREVYADCIACHGPDGQAGVNNARRFQTEAFRNGADPYSQFVTLTRGYNLMPAQPTLSVEEKYAVIAYVREEFMREQNPDEYTTIDDDYLANGPWPAPGTGDGEESHPYGRNARKAMTIPVKALSALAVEQAPQSPVDVWREVVAAVEDELPPSQRQAIARSRLSPYEAQQLLKALRSDDVSDFVQTVGDFIDGLALLPQSHLVSLRQQLRPQLEDYPEPLPEPEPHPAVD